MATYVDRRSRSRARRRRRCHASDNRTYAALDLGTNNCRLLVARPTDAGFRVIDAFSRIVRLGEGLGGNGQLSEAAMERTIGALKICADKMRRDRVDQARSVATAACRQAENCDAFLDRVAAETGIEIETISSTEEARLALLGCMPLLDGNEPHGLVFDIGGGSTEIVWLDLSAGRPDIIGCLSMPHGVVNLSERQGAGDIGDESYRNIVDEFAAHMAEFCGQHGIGEAVERREVQMLGTSGTVTTLAGVNLDLPRYDRAAVDGTFLGAEEARRVSERLRAMDDGERAAHPCIGAERADLVVAGCAVLETILARWGVARLRVADRGLREGILLELMSRAGSDRVATGDGAT
ncbi:MAG: Ppx/GppA phosphatase family protein [Alphaproteobacteria bacterium]|nr:Ppx/GppA phosphatase family protein [Alphaproteobacteria bacterium]MDP6604024.1 Ppx/GppA phosphatase family protein [Rhodospirillales bacterium]